MDYGVIILDELIVNITANQHRKIKYSFKLIELHQMSESSRSDVAGDSLGFSLSISGRKSALESFRADFLRIRELERLEIRQTSAGVRHGSAGTGCELIYQWPKERRELVEIPVPRRRSGRPPQVTTPPLPVIQKVHTIPVFEKDKPAQASAATSTRTRQNTVLPAALVSALPQQIQQHLGVTKPAPKTRTNFTQQQRQLLDKFFFEHIDHPYVEHKDLEKLERETNLTKRQIRVFMTNARMRKYPKYRGVARSRTGIPGPIPHVAKNQVQYAPPVI